MPDRAKTSETGRLLTPRRVIVAIIAVYLVLFVLLNTRRVHVSFVVFSVRTHLLTALVLVAALGFVAGFFVGGRARSGRRSKAAAGPPPELEPDR